MARQGISFVRILLALALAAFLLTACAKKECSIPSDCGSNTNCMTYGCSAEGKCMKNVKPNCCGNFKCDANENSCTCKDCGSCGGKVTYNVTTAKGTKAVDTKYSIYQCDASSNCVAAANPDLKTELKLTSVIEEKSVFKIDILSTLNKPFNTATDQLSVRATLSDMRAAGVAGGITITSIQVLNGNNLMGEKILNTDLSQVGSSITELFNLQTAQTLPEEDALVSLKVFYSYSPVDSKGVVLPVKRASQTVAISPGKITFLKP